MTITPDQSGPDQAATRETEGPVTRFAPSPTGRLHLGHVYAALTAKRRAHWGETAGRRGQYLGGQYPGGRYLVRIEDIDVARSRPEWERDLLADLDWLGLGSEGPVLRQSERLDLYRDAVVSLEALGVLYPCFCTRREIEAELAAIASAPHSAPCPLTTPDGPHGPLYPGTCRNLTDAERAQRFAGGRPHSLRLDARRASDLAGPLSWTEEGLVGEKWAGEGAVAPDSLSRTVAVEPSVLGDVILARKDAPASYHVAVVVDDAAQGITVVTRGQDLFPSTHIHRLLQALLGLPEPVYHHHPLIADADGRRLAKRADSLSIAALRDSGSTPADIVRLALGGPFVTSSS